MGRQTMPKKDEKEVKNEDAMVEDGDEDDEEGEEFEVEKIEKKRVKDGVTEYYVRWKNYGDKDRTWEPEENLETAKSLVAAFEKSLADKSDKSPEVSKKRGRPKKNSDKDSTAADDDEDDDVEDEQDATGYDAVPPWKLAKIVGARKDVKTDQVQFLCSWDDHDEN